MYQDRMIARTALPDRSEMQSASRRYDVAMVVAFAALLHLVIFALDVARNFAPFLRGDRSPVRWYAADALLRAGPGHILETLTSAPTAAGEYLFGTAFASLGGIPAIVAMQIALFLLSLYCLCKIAETFPWRYSVLAVGGLYTLLPHNLVFTHQFVTEAIATPFVVFFLYFYCRAARSGRRSDQLLSGLMLGIAIFVRPPLMPVLPVLVLVRFLYRRYFSDISWRGFLMICAMATLPMIAWTAAYTAETGRVGYTSGVANLGWNLRSKVFLVYSRNNLEQPPFLRGYPDYPSLYNDSNGISVGTFAGFVAEHPLLFLQAATEDALIFLGRGDISKVLVDYMGDPGVEALKYWRTWVSKADYPEIVGYLTQNAGAFWLVAAEMAVSLLTLACSLTALIFACYCLLRPRRIAEALGKIHVAMILTLSSVLLAVFASAQLVDQAQGRLRHPAEACIILIMGYAAWYYSATRRKRPIA